MQKILRLLTKSPIVSEFEILDYRSSSDLQYIKLKVVLKNGSLLHVREYISDKELNYSYNWQESDGTLITRWDDAPHHPSIQSFPHHKHDPDPQFSEEIEFTDIISIIPLKLS